MGILVAYFSRTGENSVGGKIEIIEKGYTEIVAEKIAAYTGGKLFKMEPKVAYPFKYDECVKRAKEEAKVELSNYLDNLDEFDTVFVGFPNWWRSYPRIVASFLDRYSFVGKKVIPFCTNEEGAFGIGELELRGSVKGAIIKSGFACRGYDANSCDEALKAWLKKVL